MKNRQQRRRRAQGFTLVEVMMAVGVITVGAMALMAMQKATIVANTSARELSAANEINRSWIERVKLDAINWTTQGCNQTAIQPVVDTTNMLSTLDATCAATLWLTPPGGGAANFRGHPITLPVADGEPPPRFCTNHRFDWVVPGSVARVTVRTWWHRAGSGQGNTNIVDYSRFQDCSDPEGVSDQIGPGGILRHVQAQTLIRWHQPIQR